jgi:hypothetical protein
MFPHDGSCATLEDWFDPAGYDTTCQRVSKVPAPRHGRGGPRLDLIFQPATAGAHRVSEDAIDSSARSRSSQETTANQTAADSAPTKIGTLDE